MGVFSVNDQDALDATMYFVRLCRNPPEGYLLSTILREIGIMYPQYSDAEIKKSLQPAMQEMVQLLAGN